MKKDVLNINVFNGDDGIKYIRYDDMVSMLNRIKEDNDERNKEIERLNNIMNEYENELEEAIKTISHISIDGASGLHMALTKIKELKGSDKE